MDTGEEETAETALTPDRLLQHQVKLKSSVPSPPPGHDDPHHLSGRVSAANSQRWLLIGKTLASPRY
jgi:hypothetical protein